MDKEEWDKKYKAGKVMFEKYKRKIKSKSKQETESHLLTQKTYLSSEQNDYPDRAGHQEDSTPNLGSTISAADGCLNTSGNLSFGVLNEASLNFSLDCQCNAQKIKRNISEDSENESARLSSGKLSVLAGIESEIACNSDANNFSTEPSPLPFINIDHDLKSEPGLPAGRERKENLPVDISCGNISSCDSKTDIEPSFGRLSLLQDDGSTDSLTSQIESVTESIDAMMSSQSEIAESDPAAVNTLSEMGKRLVESQEGIKQRDMKIGQLYRLLKTIAESQKIDEETSETWTSEVQNLRLVIEQANAMCKKQKDKSGGISADEFFEEEQRSIEWKQAYDLKCEALTEMTRQTENLRQQLFDGEQKQQMLAEEKQKSTKEIQNLMQLVEKHQSELFSVNKEREEEKCWHKKDLTSLQDELDERYGNQINIIKESMRKSFKEELEAVKLDAKKSQMQEAGDHQMATKLLKSMHEDGIESLKNQFALTKCQLDQQIQQLQKKVEDQNSNLLSYEMTSKMAVGEAEELNNKYNDECTKSNKLQSEIGTLYTEIQSLKSYIAKLSDKPAEKDEPIRQLESNSENLCANEMRFKEEISDLQVEIGRSQGENVDTTDTFKPDVAEDASNGALIFPLDDNLQGSHVIQTSSQCDKSSCDNLSAVNEELFLEQHNDIPSDSVCDKPVLYVPGATVPPKSEDGTLETSLSEIICDSTTLPSFNNVNEIVSSDILASNARDRSPEYVSSNFKNYPEVSSHTLEEKIAQLEETIKLNETKLSQITQEHIQTVNLLNVEHEKETEDLHKRLAKQSETLTQKDRILEEEVKKAKTELEDNYEKEIVKIRDYYDEQLSQVSCVQEWNESLNTSTKVQYTSAQVEEFVRENEQKNQDSMRHLEEEHNSKIKHLQQNHALQMQKLERDYDSEITRVQLESATEAVRIINEGVSNLQSPQATQNFSEDGKLGKLADKRDDYCEMNMLKCQHQRELVQMEAEYFDRATQLESEYEEKLKVMVIKQESYVKTLEENFKKQMLEFKEELNDEQKQSLNGIFMEFENKKSLFDSKLDESSQKIESLNQTIEKLKESHDESQAAHKEALKSLNEKKTHELITLKNEMEASWKERLQIIQSDLTTVADTEKKNLKLKHEKELLAVKENLNKKKDEITDLNEKLNRMTESYESLQEVHEELSLKFQNEKENFNKSQDEYTNQIDELNRLMSEKAMEMNSIHELLLKSEEGEMLHKIAMEDLESKFSKEAEIVMSDVEAKYTEEVETLNRKILKKDTEISAQEAQYDDLLKIYNLQKETVDDLERKLEETTLMSDECKRKFDEELNKVVRANEAKLQEETKKLKEQFMAESELVKKQRESGPPSARVTMNQEVADELKKLKLFLDTDGNKSIVQKLMNEISSLKDELEGSKQQTHLCSQKLLDESRRFGEAIALRDTENAEFENLVNALQSDRDTVQQSNAHLMRILSELVRTFISIEDIINRHLRIQSKEEPKLNEQADSSIDAPNEELCDNVDFQEEEFDITPDRIPEEIFRGPSIDLIGEDVIYGVGKRVYAAVENLIAQMPCDGTASACSKCQETDILTDQLQIETNAKEVLALELHKVKGVLSGFEAEKRNLEVEKDELEEKFRSMFVQADQYQQQLKELASEKQFLLSQVNTLSDGLSDAEKKLVEENKALHLKMQSQTKIHEGSTKSLNEKINQLKATSEEQTIFYDREIEEKNQNVADLEGQIEAMDKQLKAKKKFIEELTCEREQERDEFQKELDKLHETIKEKDKVLNMEKELSQQVEALEDQLLGKIAEQDQDDFHKESIINEFNHAQSELKSTKEIVSNLESQVKLKNETVEHLEQELQQIKVVLSHNCDFQDELNSEIVLLRQSSVSPVDKEDSELINRVTSLNDQVKQLKISLSIFDDFKAQLQAIYQKIDHRMKNLQSRHNLLHSSSSDITTLEKCERVRSPSIEDLRELASPDDVHRLDVKIEALLVLTETIMSSSEALKVNLDSLRSSEEELLQDKHQLQKELDNQRLQLSSLRSNMQQRQQLIASPKKLNDGTSALEDKVEEEQKMRVLAEMKVADLERQLEEDEKDLKLQLDESNDYVHDLTEQLADLKDKYKNLLAETEELREHLNSPPVPDWTNDVINDKNDEINFLVKHQEALEQQLMDKAELLSLAESKWANEAVQILIEDHKIELEKLRSELDHKNESLSNFERLSMELKENHIKSKSQLSSQLLAARQQILSYCAEAEVHQSDMQESKEKYIQMNKQLESTVQRCDELLKERQALIDSLKESKSQLAAVTEELARSADCVKVLEDKQLTCKIDINELSSKLDLKKDECTDLEERLRKTEEKLEALTTEIANERQAHLQEREKILECGDGQDSGNKAMDSTKSKPFPGASASDPESCNSSFSVSTESIENWLPEPIIKVLNKVHEKGIQLLTLSEIETLRQHLSPDRKPICIEYKCLEKQIITLKEEIVALKALLSQVGREERDIDKILEIVSRIFSLERSHLAGCLEPHITSGSSNKIEEFKSLKERLNVLESYQKAAFEKLLPSMTPNDEFRVKFDHRDREYFQDEQRRLMKQIAAMEQQASLNEWKLKRQIELLSFKLEEEKVLVTTTQESLNLEKARVLELTAELNHLRSNNAHLVNTNSISSIELNKVKKSLESSRREVVELRALLDTERNKSLSIVQVLENERSNFIQLQESVDSERRLTNISESRYQALIQQLRDTVESERNISLQLEQKLHSNAQISEGSLPNGSSNMSSFPEQFRDGSRFSSSEGLPMIMSNADIQMRSMDATDGSSEVPVIDTNSHLGTPNSSEKKAVMYLTNQLSIERKNHKHDCGKLNESLQQSIKLMETNKQEKDALQMRINEMEQEKNKVIQMCINLQRELEASKMSYQEVVQNHDSHANKQADLQRDAEIKLEEQRQSLRDLKLDLERKSQDVRILRMKLDGSNDRQIHLKRELDIANERIKNLASNPENLPKNSDYLHFQQIEEIRQKLVVLATKCHVSDANDAPFKELSRYIHQLSSSQINQFDFSPDSVAKEVMDHNHELSALILKLTNDKIELKDDVIKLEAALTNLRQSEFSRDTMNSESYIEKVLASERSAFAQEQAQLHLSLHRAQMELHKLRNDKYASNSSINRDDFKACYIKFLRSESFRKALVYQKKFLLILLGGYQDTENATLSMLTKMGAHPSVNRTSLLPLSQPRAFLKFRSYATVIIAVSRMKFLVRRWENISNRAASQPSSEYRRSRRSDRGSNCTSSGSSDTASDQGTKSDDVHHLSRIAPAFNSSLVNSQHNVNCDRNMINPEMPAQRLHSLHHALGFRSSSEASE